MSTKCYSPPLTIKPIDMKLGDVVCMVLEGDEKQTPWQYSIVKQITNATVTLFRPYGVHANFSSSSRVMCYIGIEEYKIPVNYNTQYLLFERCELK